MRRRACGVEERVCGVGTWGLRRNCLRAWQLSTFLIGSLAAWQGKGLLAERLAAAFGDRVHVSLVDLQEALVARAAARTGAAARGLPTLSFHAGDAVCA